MNLTQLSKDDKIKELIKDVKSKNSLRMKFSFDVSILSDQELEDFFELNGIESPNQIDRIYLHIYNPETHLER